MPFWIYMLLIDLLIPLTMVGFGLYFRKNMPPNINTFFGYRTKRSMKNQDTWRYAHEHCGKVWFWTGLIMSFLTPALMIGLFCFSYRSAANVGTYGGVICVVQLLTLIASIFSTELTLKKKFDRK